MSPSPLFVPPKFPSCPRCPRKTRRKTPKKPINTGFLRLLGEFFSCPRFVPAVPGKTGSGDTQKAYKYGLSLSFRGSLSPLSPISRKTILFFIFRFPISFFKIGDNGDKMKKKPHISLIFGLFSIFMFQIFRGHGDKPGDSGDKWQILELSDNMIYFLILYSNTGKRLESGMPRKKRGFVFFDCIRMTGVQG